MTEYQTDPILDQLAREISQKVIRNLAVTPSPGFTSIPLPLSPPAPLHPSQERLLFTPDQLGEILEFLSPKTCVMEARKACDQCDICSTRGF